MRAGLTGAGAASYRSAMPPGDIVREEACAQASGAAKKGVFARLATRRGMTQFVRNFLVSLLSFGSELALLWALVGYAGMHPIPAVIVTFVVANTIHYVIGRKWIFIGSSRGMTSGYVYFLISAAIGLVLTVALYWLMVDVLHVEYITARIVVSIFAGFVVFLLNAVLNFRSL